MNCTSWLVSKNKMKRVCKYMYLLSSICLYKKWIRTNRGLWIPLLSSDYFLLVEITRLLRRFAPRAALSVQKEVRAGRTQQVLINHYLHHTKRTAFAVPCVVEITRLELVASALRTQRSTNWAISPFAVCGFDYTISSEKSKRFQPCFANFFGKS